MGPTSNPDAYWRAVISFHVVGRDIRSIVSLICQMPNSGPLGLRGRSPAGGKHTGHMQEDAEGR